MFDAYSSQMDTTADYTVVTLQPQFEMFLPVQCRSGSKQLYKKADEIEVSQPTPPSRGE